LSIGDESRPDRFSSLFYVKGTSKNRQLLEGPKKSFCKGGFSYVRIQEQRQIEVPNSLMATYAQKNRIKQLAGGYAFVLPGILLMSIFIIYPAISTLYQSFLNAEGDWVGLKNFIELLGHYDTLDLERFPTKGPPWGSLINNGIWILLHLPTTVMFGLIFAVMLNSLKGGPAIRGIIFLGMVIPMIIGGVIIRFLFDENSGIVPMIMRNIGIESLSRSWTNYPQTSLIALIIGSILLWTGFSLTMHAAGLSSVPKSFYEAAVIDGAGHLRIFFQITIPMLAPVTAVVVAMTLLYEIKIFDIVYAATMGGPGGSSMVLSLQMYFYAFRRLDYNMASAVATLLTGFTVIVSIWLVRRTVKQEKA
jgi:multiple sugar transport system permease protein